MYEALMRPAGSPARARIDAKASLRRSERRRLLAEAWAARREHQVAGESEAATLARTVEHERRRANVAEAALSDLRRRLSLELDVPAARARRVIEVVCRHYGVEVVELISDRRGRGLSGVRRVAAYLLTKLTPHSMTKIGRLIGRSDHSCISKGLADTENRLKRDRQFANEVAALWDRCLLPAEDCGEKSRNSPIGA